MLRGRGDDRTQTVGLGLQSNLFTFLTLTTSSQFYTNKNRLTHFILSLKHFSTGSKNYSNHTVRGLPKTQREHTGLHLLLDLPVTHKPRTTLSRTVLLPHSNFPVLVTKKTVSRRKYGCGHLLERYDNLSQFNKSMVLLRKRSVFAFL